MKLIARLAVFLTALGICTYIAIQIKLSNDFGKASALIIIVFLCLCIGFYIGRYEGKSTKNKSLKR
jgi:Na+-transporting NADH:ubiquinone oxidoreductase subunit NqrE